MAQFSFTHFISYDGNGDGAAFPLDEVLTGTLTDGEPDTVFDTGDVVTSTTLASNVPIQGTYLGTTTVQGQDFPVFYFANTNESVVFLTFVPASLPSPLQVNEGVNFDAPCFLTGTRIATPDGHTPVEALRIGDLILTADGRSVPVKWIGHRSVGTTFAPARRLLPVCIAAGALGQDLPERDLYVTADHAFLLDGVLVTAGALVGAMGITTVPASALGTGYTVYHIETEAHDIILAEGVAAETYVDYVGRQAFDNHAEYVALYGAER